mmetsp:Transcript_16108/g.41050  ORF Transcript_16108/g.41050 Transcript_16108/m.41050 type:complete len:255 (+) Transcript_16108:1022-1786(+)
MLDVEQDLARLAVVADERVQRVALHYPADQPGVGREGHHGVLRDGQREPRTPVGGGAVLVRGEQLVHQADQLHHTLVLPQVLVPLEQECVRAAVVPVDLELPRPLLGGYHRQLGVEGADAHHRLPCLVRTGHREHQVARGVQSRRDMGEVELGELAQLPVDAREHFVIDLPRLVEESLRRAAHPLARPLVLRAPRERLVEVEGELVEELHLPPRLRPLLHQRVHGPESCEHGARILVAEPQTTCLVERLQPQLG